MIEKDDKAIPCAGNEPFLNEDTCHDCTYNTTCAMGRKYVESIVYAAL